MTDLAECIAPTPERIAHAGNFLELPHVDQRTERRAYRAVGVVYTLHRDDKISPECFRAHQRFEADYNLAHRASSAIGSYGERIGGAGDGLGEDRKAIAWRRAGNALASIGSQRGRMALVMSVTARPVDTISTARPYSLEEIGRAVSHFRTKDQARAAGIATLDAVLWQLHRYYEPG